MVYTHGQGVAREKIPDTVVGDMAPQLACDHHLSAGWQVQHLVWLVYDLQSTRPRKRVTCLSPWFMILQHHQGVFLQSEKADQTV